jgi:hypothetical protein
MARAEPSFRARCGLSAGVVLRENRLISLVIWWTLATMSGTTPIKPSEFRALIPDVNDSLCTVLVKFFKFMLAYWKWYRWAFVFNTGEISEEFGDQICEAIRNCSTPSTE